MGLIQQSHLLLKIKIHVCDISIQFLFQFNSFIYEDVNQSIDMLFFNSVSASLAEGKIKKMIIENQQIVTNK